MTLKIVRAFSYWADFCTADTYPAKNISAYIIVFLFSFCSIALSSTQECLDDPDFYQYLEGTIGKGNPHSPSIHLLPCDTMYVSRGIQVMVLKNTYLAFADPKPGNIIIVRGDIIFEGTASHKVRVSSSLDKDLINMDLMKEPWQGIIVEPTGSAVFSHAIVYGASVPVNVRSRDLNIQNTLFSGATEILISSSKPLILTDGNYVTDFNLSRHLRMASTARPVSGSSVQDQPSSKKSPSLLENPWLYVAGGIIIVGSVATAILLTDESGEVKVGGVIPHGGTP